VISFAYFFLDETEYLVRSVKSINFRAVKQDGQPFCRVFSTLKGTPPTADKMD